MLCTTAMPRIWGVRSILRMVRPAVVTVVVAKDAVPAGVGMRLGSMAVVVMSPAPGASRRAARPRSPPGIVGSCSGLAHAACSSSSESVGSWVV